MEKTKKITMSALLIAVGTILAHIIYVPIGIAKCFPIQHAINVLSAIVLGPTYTVCNAFLISLLRNILGIGSLLAFPGSMIGALLAGIIYKKFNKTIFAVIGEIIGTGILGSLLAFPIANLIMGKKVGAFFFIIPFLVSTIGGSLISYFIVGILEKTKVIKINKV